MTKAWKEHQETITRLYINESRTLDDVREIMQKEHNFKASTRSYRQHFDQWNLGKYNCKKRTARRQQKDLVRMTRPSQSPLAPCLSPMVATPNSTALLPAAAAVFAVAGARYDDPRDPLSPESLSTEHTYTNPHHHHHHHHHQEHEDEERKEEEYAIKQEIMTGIRRDSGPQQYVYDQGLPSSYSLHHMQQQRHYSRPRTSWGPAELPSPPADFEHFNMTTSPATSAASVGMEMVTASPRQQQQGGYHHVLQQGSGHDQRVGRMFSSASDQQQHEQRVGRIYSATVGEHPQEQRRAERMFSASEHPQQQRYTYHHPLQCRYRSGETEEPLATPRVWAV